MLILAAAELVKIEIENAKIRRAQVGRQEPENKYPGMAENGHPYDVPIRADGK